MNVKQVIVVRKDLNMRRGKEDAQVAHAAMMFLVERVKGCDWHRELGHAHPYPTKCVLEQHLSFTVPEMEWLEGNYTKVVVQVDSSAALHDIYEKARAAGLQVHVVQDLGLTEFRGIPTHTCIAIGPDLAERIDPVTSSLPLR